MKEERIEISGIPAIVWGEPSEKVYLWVQGKMSSKEEAGAFAEIAQEKGFQTVSFDLPRHGERAGSPEPCDVWHGAADLTQVGDWVFSRWEKVSLYACSLGAFFSLHAYPDRNFQKCLFQSPIVEMEGLIGKMMAWFDVSESRLEREGEVDTPIDVLSWRYYQYVKAHPILRWDSPTVLLYGGRDDLQDRAWMEDFALRFGCSLTVAEESGHAFETEKDREIVTRWLRENIG